MAEHDEIFSIAAEPEHWKLVSSTLPIEDNPVLDAGYARWRERGNTHSHSFRELLFCFSGETFEHFAGRDYRCRPGSVFLFDAREAHASGYPKEGGSFVHLWIVGLGGTAVANFYCQREGKPEEQRMMPMVLADAECRLLNRSWSGDETPMPWMTPAFRRTSLTSAIFAVILRAIEHWHAPPPADAAPLRCQEIVAAVKRHIEGHLADAETLDVLAHLSGYSKFHFSRMFKGCSGQTVHNFVDSCRMKKARELIQGGVPRKEIAGTLGFSCPAAFSNWLRKNRVQLSADSR